MKRFNAFVLALVLISSLWPTVTVGQVPNTMPPNTVICRLGAGTAGPPQACPFSLLGGQLAPYFPVTPTAPGIDQNILNSQTSNYTIASTDCGKTIQAGTGSTGQFTITLPTISGFPTTCSVLIKNGDGAAGKILSGFPNDLATILYPKQSVGVKIVNGAWRSFYNPGPWTPAAGSFTLFASASGSDTNDCLSAATACTTNICLDRNKINQPGSVNIQLVDGTYSSLDRSGSAICSILGDNGGSSNALVGLIGNCTTPGNVTFAVPNNATGIEIKDGGLVSASCITFTGGNGSTGIAASGQLSVADIDKIVWGTWGTSGSHVSGASGAYINLLADGETITGNFTSSFHWNLNGNVALSANGPTIIPSAVSWTSGGFLAATGNPFISVAGWTTSGSGVGGSTGQRAALSGPGYMSTAAAGSCNSIFPGNVACAFTGGFIDNAGDPQTAPFAAPTTIFASLPTPVAGMYAYISDGKSSNCGDSACTAWGTTVTGGAGSLKLLIWYNGTNWTLAGK